MRQLGSEFTIRIPRDESGLTGRECPLPECLGYFKIQFGTGLKGENLPCHCPYCGHADDHQKFWTREQIKYLKSVAVNRASEALIRDLKASDWKVTGRPHPIHYYREKKLETEVVCDRCTLRYGIYGVFGFCPDCGVHNSLQILNKNLELAEKEIALGATLEGDLADHLVADALENAVSAFDGFGRERLRIHSVSLSEPAKVANISFQNLPTARRNVQKLLGFDLAAAVESEEWGFVHQCFQKRHLLAHKMAVVDKGYLQATKDPQAVIGRKISIEPEEVTALTSLLRKLGDYFAGQTEDTR